MTTTTAADKSASMLAHLDLNHTDLGDLSAAADPAAEYVRQVASRRWPHYRFETRSKRDIVDFLKKHYEAWQDFDPAPAQRFADMSIEDAQKPRGLSGILALGQAWWATGDPKWGSTFEKFFLAVPTGDMFTWYSFNGAQASIELAPFMMLLDCPGFTPEGRIAFLDHLFSITADAWDNHTSHWDQLSLGTEGHNWYLHGMHGVPQVGLMFPELNRADFYLRTGMSVVEEYMRGHHKADGGARETTLGYQAGSMMDMWDHYLIARRNHIHLSEGFGDRLLNATLFLLRLASPQGGLPSFGDGGHAPGALTALAAYAAAASGDRHCKWYAQRFRQMIPNAREEASDQIPLGAFFQVGLEGALAYAQIPAADPNHTSVLMGPTGYTALRDGDTKDAAYMAVAHADRGPIVTSHGHNDILALDVQAHGTRYIGEMGCAPYGESPGRDYDQQTHAHSTITINGEEQVPILSEWRWSGTVTPAVRRWVSQPSHDLFHGIHEGFYKYRVCEALHGRKIVFLKREHDHDDSPPSYWLIFDWIETNVPSCDVDAYFHAATKGRHEGTTITIDGKEGHRLAVFPPNGQDVTLSRFECDGRDAYFSEKKLDKNAHPSFVYHHAGGRTCLVWVVVPLTPGMDAPAAKLVPITVNGRGPNAADATGVTVSFAKHTDTVVINHRDYDAQLEGDGVSCFGTVLIRREDHTGATTEVLHTTADGAVGR